MSKSLSHTVSSIYNSSSLAAKAKKYDLNIKSVTWEDTARFKNSSWGANISDMTLATADGNLMPVIRKPNFSDETSDLPIENFSLTVGNETGSNPSRVSLSDYLKNISSYTSSNVKNMVVSRDTHILTSAQFCILPLSEEGECEFNVQLYNYQSSSTDPAVLVVVASSQGTSAQVVTGNTEKLYINLNGKAANYLAKRLKQDRKEKGKALEGAMDLDEQERNALFIYQIPLKQKPRLTRSYNYQLECCSSNSFQSMAPAGCAPKSMQASCEDDDCEEECDYEMDGCLFGTNSVGYECCVKEKAPSRSAKVVGMDNAVLRAGATHSDFKGVGSFSLERDDRYPVRCTVQFYKVTDDSDIPEEAFQEMREKIDSIYSTGKATGSLVVSGETKRVTEPVKDLDFTQKSAMPMLAFFKK